jgi:hypothetical protein
MRFALAVAAVVLLAAPVAAQHRSRGPAPARHPAFSGPVVAKPRHFVPRAPFRGRAPYSRCAPVVRPLYGYYPSYAPFGYNFYPGLYVDQALETYYIRQQQDFSDVPLHSGLGGYDSYGTRWYPGDEEYFDEPPRRGSGYGRNSYEQSESGWRYGPSGPNWAAPRVNVKTRELVVDGVPTLVSDN